MFELHEDFMIDEIVEIKKVGIRETIDIEVDGDNLFVCNGILTHNSAAGDVADVTEESIQGGISKIQSADNVIAFIPNSKSRELGILKAKLLKTRDSSGVGKYLTFKTEWKTLSFIPVEEDEDGKYVEKVTNDLSKNDLKRKLKSDYGDKENEKTNKEENEKSVGEENEKVVAKNIREENTKTDFDDGIDTDGLKPTKKGRRKVSDISGISLLKNFKKI